MPTCWTSSTSTSHSRGYTNRSEAFRDLVRDELIRAGFGSARQPVVGTVTLVYDHHVRMLSDKLTDMQHEPITTFFRLCMFTSITTTAWRFWW